MRDRRIEFTFLRHLDIDIPSSSLIFKDDLLQCDEPEAPKYPHKGSLLLQYSQSPLRKKVFQLTTRLDITKTNVTLVSDFTQVAKGEFKERMSPDGLPYLSIAYKLVIEHKNANMEFFAEVNGKKLGVVTPDYTKF